MQIFDCEVTKDVAGKLWVALPDWHGNTITGKPFSLTGRAACIAHPGDSELRIRRRIHDLLPTQYEALEDSQGRKACRELSRQVVAWMGEEEV